MTLFLLKKHLPTPNPPPPKKKKLLSCIPLLVTGDFNIHVDCEDNPESRSFADLLESLCCTQHVQFCTHTHGHTLDLLISRQSDNVIVGQPWPDDSLISDCAQNPQIQPRVLMNWSCYMISLSSHS